MIVDKFAHLFFFARIEFSFELRLIILFIDILDPSSKNFYHAPPDRLTMPSMNFLQQQPHEDDGLGPLPPKWEKAYTENGETYFIE